jgi:hypothetical protein
MTTCVLFREKKKEDIRQRGGDAEEQWTLRTDRQQLEGEGVSVESRIPT